MKQDSSLLVVLFFSFLLLPGSSSLLNAQEETGDASVPTPEQFFGHPVGADRKLFSYPKLLEYLRKLNDQSPRMKQVKLGTSTEGRPFVLTIFSTEENLGRLDELKQLNRKIANPPAGTKIDIDPKQLSDGAAFVCAGLNIHSNEIGSSQMAAEAAYNLVTDNLPFDYEEVFEDVVFLMIPSLNPDGQVKVVDWYNKYRGTKFEGGPMPYLYHRYAGHDNNRDWFMYNLKETRLGARVFYQEWVPQIIVDVHQMGHDSARMFVPPYDNPPNPNIHPLVWRSLEVYGSNIAFDLEKRGLSGVEHGKTFSGWWMGGTRTSPLWHNQIGILFEVASVRRATPVYVEPNEIPREQSIDHPNPWNGGWWRLRDIVEYQMTGLWSVLETAKRHKKDVLNNQVEMTNDAIQKGETEAPYAYVLPPDQHDPSAMKRMLEALHTAGVRIHRATDSFSVDSTTYPKGTVVIRMNQAYRPYIHSVLSRQDYPEKFGRPYDTSGWTMHLLMGVDVKPLNQSVEIPTEEIVPDELVNGQQERSGWYSVPASNTDVYRLINRVFEGEGTVFRDPSSHRFYLRVETPSVFDGLTLDPTSVDSDSIPDEAEQLSPPRIGLYKANLSSMDHGWTRLLLDQFSFSFERVFNKRVREGNLRESFDCLILPNVPPGLIKGGSPANDDPSEIQKYPEKYRKGLGSKGVEHLRSFVKRGGTLITWGDSSRFAINHFPIPVSNGLDGVASGAFSSPGSILKLTADRSYPVNMGMPEQFSGYFTSDSLTFRTEIPFGETDRRVLARTPDAPLLRSGYLEGAEIIENQPVAVRATLNDGRIFLFGFQPQFRAWTYGTFRLVFNAIHASSSQ